MNKLGIIKFSLHISLFIAHPHIDMTYRPEVIKGLFVRKIGSVYFFWEIFRTKMRPFFPVSTPPFPISPPFAAFPDPRLYRVCASANLRQCWRILRRIRAQPVIRMRWSVLQGDRINMHQKIC